ncbi:hypothetical protein [Paenibacillus sp. PAMC 26794]|uniref:hypothetical protein n=1 Tax=Paenibacillus sp. PAMC 26794 TaxID=1257080 RepID=UPI00030D1FAC|nr:hypothetical protein [Paenibacillus sp. PAMC 26794]
MNNPLHLVELVRKLMDSEGTEAEIQLAQEVLEGNAYILVREAAFAILVAHQQVNGAASALESLQSDPDFGSSAMRVLYSKQGSYNQ